MIKETGLRVKHTDSSHSYVVQTKTTPVTIELATEYVTDIEFAKHICRRCSVVIHLAAQTAVQLSISEPNTDFASNVIGTFNYLEASRQNNVPTFFTASSSAVIGNADTSVEDLPLHPISPYGASKATVEAYCSSFYHSYGINTLPMRFSNVYGPYSTAKTNVIANFCRQALSGQPLRIYGDGLQTRDFIFVDDLVTVIIDIALGRYQQSVSTFFGNPSNIATGINASVLDVTTIFRHYFTPEGVNIIVESLPALPGDTRHSAPSVKRLSKLVDLSQLKHLDVAIPETIDWFKNFS